METCTYAAAPLGDPLRYQPPDMSGFCPDIYTTIKPNSDLTDTDTTLWGCPVCLRLDNAKAVLRTIYLVPRRGLGPSGAINTVGR